MLAFFLQLAIASSCPVTCARLLNAAQACQDLLHMLPCCRRQYDKLQQDLEQASSQASKLAEENCHLKSRSLPPEVDRVQADPLAAQQVTQQMEALLLEKSRLAQENDRLLRENTGLQVGHGAAVQARMRAGWTHSSTVAGHAGAG